MGLIKKWQIEKSNTLELADNLAEVKDGGITPSKLATITTEKAYSLSDDVYYDSGIDTQKTTSTSYVKLMEITLGNDWPSGTTIRVAWNHWNLNTTDATYTQIWINDEAVGSEHASTTYSVHEVSEDVTVNPGDKVQIYGRVTGGAECCVSGLKIKGSSHVYYPDYAEGQKYNASATYP